MSQDETTPSDVVSATSLTYDRTMERTLVVGAGYLGKRVAVDLVKNRHQVVTVSSDAYKANLLDHDDNLVICLPPVAAYLERLHCLVADAAHAGGRRLVFISSTGVYAENSGGWVDEDSPLDVASPRGIRLASAEEIVRTSHKALVTILRLAGIYGPNRDPSARYLSADPGSDAETIWTNRIYIEDAVGAVAHALRHDLSGTWNVCDNEPATWKTIAQWLLDQKQSELIIDADGKSSATSIMKTATTTSGMAPSGDMALAPSAPSAPSAATASGTASASNTSPTTDRTFKRRGGNKRVRNDRLRAAGWTPNFPDFRAGLLDLKIHHRGAENAEKYY